MASNPLIPISDEGNGFNLTTSFQTIYTVPGDILRAGIDAIVFNNYSSSNTTITIRLSQTGSTDLFDEVVTERVIRKKDSFLAPGIIGQAILSGGTIQVKVGNDDRVNGKLTVTEISS